MARQKEEMVKLFIFKIAFVLHENCCDNTFSDIWTPFVLDSKITA